MNVLFLSEVTAANARNGAERTLREQVLGLNKRGHAVSVVTRTMAEDPRLTASVDGATEYRYPFSQRNEVAFVLSSVAGSLRTLDGAAARQYFDVALIHQSLAGRSEEHTSELQSRLHLVCRLLLEKKKKTAITRRNDEC